MVQRRSKLIQSSETLFNEGKINSMSVKNNSTTVKKVKNNTMRMKSTKRFGF